MATLAEVQSQLARLQEQVEALRSAAKPAPAEAPATALTPRPALYPRAPRARPDTLEEAQVDSTELLDVLKLQQFEGCVARAISRHGAVSTTSPSSCCSLRSRT